MNSSHDIRAQKEVALARLANQLAHRLNNILVAIVGNVAFLRELGDLTGSLADALGDMEAASESAVDLANHLQMYAGAAILNPRVVDLRALVEQAASLLSDRFDDLKLHIHLPSAPCLVKLDPARALDALVELARNAKAANCGNLFLTIYVKAAEPPKRLFLVVRDDGHGMSLPVLESATDPMFTTKRAGEAGWGLSLLSGFIRQSGGTIRIDSSLGEGTQIEIALPMAEP